MIRALFFDIGNVLITLNVGVIVRGIAGPVSRHPLRAARYFLGSRFGEALERGVLSTQELFDRSRAEFGFSGSLEQFRQLWNHSTLHQETADLLGDVARTHNVFLLSNISHLHYGLICERYEFPRLVHGAILSCDLGIRKPETAIYREALRRAAVAPSECLLIDDVAVNVEAARNLGMQALRYVDATSLRQDLTQLGVVVSPSK